MTKEWLGYDKKSRNIKNIYVGINGKARKVTAAYVGVNGKARKAYPIIPIPTVSGEYTYDGTTKEAVITNFDSNYVSVSGESATNAGTHIVTFSLTDSNAVWEDGTRTDKSGTWIIKKKKISAPTLSYPTDYSYFTKKPATRDEYDGWDITIIVSSYDSNIISVGGTQTAKNAGTYNVIFTIISQNYEWEDGTTVKSVPWTIKKASINSGDIWKSGAYRYSSGYSFNFSWNVYNSRGIAVRCDIYNIVVTGDATYTGNVTNRTITFDGYSKNEITVTIKVYVSPGSNKNSYLMQKTVTNWYY